MGNSEFRAEGAATRMSHGSTGTAGGSFGAARRIKLELDIQKERMGKLIGTNGQTIKGIQQQVQDVRLETPTKDDAAGDKYKFVAVTIAGRASDVFKAGKMVDGVATACLAVVTAAIPQNFVALLQTPSIQRMKQTIPVDTLVLPRKADKQPKVVLEGHLEHVMQAYYFICEELVRKDKEAQDARENQKLMQISRKRAGVSGEGVDAEVAAGESEETGKSKGSRGEKGAERQVAQK